MTGATIESVDVVAPAGDLVENLHTRGYLLGLEVARAIGPGHLACGVLNPDRSGVMLYRYTGYSAWHGAQIELFVPTTFDGGSVKFQDVVDEWAKVMSAEGGS